ncbi:MAG: rhomboid family intramembrane serine protease [Candidatus Hodarchaeales archaeon]|jgi:rhomboid protease GluP
MIFEEIKAFTRGNNDIPLITASLTILILIIYFLLFLMDPFNSLLGIPPNNLEPWLLNGMLFWEGEYHRMFSSIFLHYHLAHVGSNLLFLLIYGLRYEELADSRLLLIIFLISGFSGNMFTIIILPGIYSLGASGAIFGVFGALLVVLHKNYPSGLKTSIFIAIIFFSLTIASDTNFVAHGGGLITGFTIQFLYSKALASKTDKNSKEWRRLE